MEELLAKTPEANGETINMKSKLMIGERFLSIPGMRKVGYDGLTTL